MYLCMLSSMLCVCVCMWVWYVSDVCCMTICIHTTLCLAPTLCHCHLLIPSTLSLNLHQELDTCLLSFIQTSCLDLGLVSYFFCNLHLCKKLRIKHKRYDTTFFLWGIILFSYIDLLTFIMPVILTNPKTLVPSRYFCYWVNYTLYMPTTIDMVSFQNDTSFG